ncbi:hypothetical protein HZH66_005032 [Vespula vulgaris]|uniref:Uncharacterized protein n=1 Tax=Vespula vulgaris TaxID=7454 RepID=A0A834NAH5_VESVU|nr:hypothetical protein HZH66_005032 [Vespula vulgaris]
MDFTQIDGDVETYIEGRFEKRFEGSSEPRMIQIPGQPFTIGEGKEKDWSFARLRSYRLVRLVIIDHLDTINRLEDAQRSSAFMYQLSREIELVAEARFFSRKGHRECNLVLFERGGQEGPYGIIGDEWLAFKIRRANQQRGRRVWLIRRTGDVDALAYAHEEAYGGATKT